MHVGYDVLGNIAILKFDRDAKQKEKKVFAVEFLRSHKPVRTVVEKVEGFKGRLRKQKTKHLAGEKTKEALYKENGCIFRLNVDTCYFSPRLASDRLEIAEQVKRYERVLVMFGGVAPYAIVIARKKKLARVVSVEINRECTRYALMNVKRNKLQGMVEVMQGDVRKKLPLVSERFDRVIMPRPQLKDHFLDVAFSKVKQGGMVHYYGFYKEEEKHELKGLIETEARKAGKKVRIQKIKQAGDIGPYKFRFRADVKMLS